eukprot:s4112_g2.t1
MTKSELENVRLLEQISALEDVLEDVIHDSDDSAIHTESRGLVQSANLCLLDVHYLRGLEEKKLSKKLEVSKKDKLAEELQGLESSYPRPEPHMVRLPRKRQLHFPPFLN